MGADGSHNSSVPPPFLTKTYEMVDDPATDEIVSWSENNASFVVWNVADFTKDLLPQYFKHNNFSSFVRQLNTYGFHKIDPDRQEFANEGFAKGNKDALKNIHRRKPSASQTNPSQKDNLSGCNDPAHAELEGEIQKLKEDKGILINELVKVKQLQETTEIELETLAQRLQALEGRQHGIMAFLARAMHHPNFMQFAHPSESLALSKKRRLPEQVALIGIGESWDEEGTGQLVRYPSGDTTEFAVSNLNQSEETSPVSRSSGVTLWKIVEASNVENVTNVDSVGAKSPGEAVVCSEFTCPGGDLTANGVAINELEVDRKTAAPAQEQDGIKGSKGSGSNDVFWESMLTENPRLTERDSQDARCEGQSNERWFL
ncbi:hypothetical protein GOP47_0015592 [Adiantum capillus-veneris]|uniref:HSF-type DNA-binding domain-containing protein n=1 Tax=Adiantum capillus-veneris TaxID=13818 RepID=A0A9D4UK02_ADICA|nr:hypothetical protein GOP47_0015592 [Adiantum capillus-veneris]